MNSENGSAPINASELIVSFPALSAFYLLLVQAKLRHTKKSIGIIFRIFHFLYLDIINDIIIVIIKLIGISTISMIIHSIEHINKSFLNAQRGASIGQVHVNLLQRYKNPMKSVTMIVSIRMTFKYLFIVLKSRTLFYLEEHVSHFSILPMPRNPHH